MDLGGAVVGFLGKKDIASFCTTVILKRGIFDMIHFWFDSMAFVSNYRLNARHRWATSLTAAEQMDLPEASHYSVVLSGKVTLTNLKKTNTTHLYSLTGENQ